MTTDICSKQKTSEQLVKVSYEITDQNLKLYENESFDVCSNVTGGPGEIVTFY